MNGNLTENQMKLLSQSRSQASSPLVDDTFRISSAQELDGGAKQKMELPCIRNLLEANGLPMLTELPYDVFQGAPAELPIPEFTQQKRNIRMKRKLFSDRQRGILMRWLQDHHNNPYPTTFEKLDLMKLTGLNREQINVWFTNNRVRHGYVRTSIKKMPQMP